MKWTEQEKQFLIDNYIEKGVSYCAKNLNRTAESIKSKALRLGITKKAKDWSVKEEQFLMDNYAEHGPTYCAEQLNKTYFSVCSKAQKLNLTKYSTWTKEEEQFLIDNYSQGSAYCASFLNKTYRSVQTKASHLNLESTFRRIQNNSNIVYAVYFPNLFLYKVGITNNVERRIKQFGHPCVILNAKEYDTPQEAAQVERDLLNSVTRINTRELWNGNTETFSQPSEKIKEFLGEQFADL